MADVLFNPHAERAHARVQVTVILEHMFTPAEFEEDPTLREELEADITAECGKMGKVDKVISIQPVTLISLDTLHFYTYSPVCEYHGRPQNSSSCCPERVKDEHRNVAISMWPSSAMHLMILQCTAVMRHLLYASSPC